MLGIPLNPDGTVPTLPFLLMLLFVCVIVGSLTYGLTLLLTEWWLARRDRRREHTERACRGQPRVRGTPRPEPQPTGRDPRAPEGMNAIQYRGWKERRDMADEFIRRMDAQREP